MKNGIILKEGNINLIEIPLIRVFLALALKRSLFNEGEYIEKYFGTN